MSRRRFLGLAVAAVVALAAALLLSARRNAQPDTQGAALLPTLSGELDTVSSVNLRRGSAAPTVTLHQTGGHWTVAQRADYPADVAKLRKLLLSLGDAKIVEEKTSNPANFAAIGVDDPKSPGAAGAEVSVAAKDGTHTVIVGKPVGEGNFVRRGGQNTSYSVEPGVSIDTEPRLWIDSRLPDIPSATLESIQLKFSGGPGYTIRKEPHAAGKDLEQTAAGYRFTLDGVPPGRKAADSAILSPSPNTFAGLTADDVAPAADIDFSKASVATLVVAGGNVITLTGAALGDKHWIEMQASKDDAFNARTAGHAFEIAGYRYDGIFRPLEQVLVPKPTPPPSTSPASKTATRPPTHPPVPAPTS